MRTVAPTRDGDKKQARRRVNYLVEQGRIPHPNTLPCVDCGHVWHSGERRHEYDHHSGYGAAHQFDVVSVCTRCHRVRAVERNENRGGGIPGRATTRPLPGAENPSAKLTTEAVLQIRTRARRGESGGRIAADIGMSQTQVCNIISGRAWKEGPWPQ